MRVRIAFLVALISMMTSVFSEDYSTWTYTNNVFINTSVTGANTSKLVTQFPLLVRLTSNQANVFSEALPNGADIRFTKADGVTRLKHQIERWDAVHQMAEIWVLVDSVQPNDASQLIRMYWGNSGAADSSKGAEVFDTGNGFVADWHLSHGAGNDTDVTANGFIQRQQSLGTYPPPSSTTGIIDTARQFNPNYQQGFIYSPTGGHNPSIFDMESNYSVSAWVYPSGVAMGNSSVIPSNPNTYGNVIVTNGYSSWELRAFDSISSQPSFWQFAAYDNNALFQCKSNGASPVSANNSLNGWHYIEGTNNYNSTTNVIAESLYVDGNLVNVRDTVGIDSINRIPFDIGIGTFELNAAPEGQPWDGMIEEVRLSKITESADWVKLSYATQNTNIPAVSFGIFPPIILSDPQYTTTLTTNEISVSDPSQGYSTETYPGVVDIIQNNDSAEIYLYPNDDSRFSNGSGETDIGGGNLTTDYLSAQTITSTGNIYADSMEANVITADSLIVTPNCNVPDYVFEKGYQLQSLKDLEAYVDENKHLPDVPAASEMKSGVNVGDLDLKLLKSVEDLTLHVIELNKRVDALEK